MEKGTQGIDCKFLNPDVKGKRTAILGLIADSHFRRQIIVPGSCTYAVMFRASVTCSGMKVFVISLGRAGEDAKSFVITDTESTFAGFAGADYNIQVGSPLFGHTGGPRVFLVPPAPAPHAPIAPHHDHHDHPRSTTTTITQRCHIHLHRPHHLIVTFSLM